MSLKKDDVVELVEKDDNGWWLVKMDGVEGWAPNNYLELVPPKAVSAPPPPPRSRPAPTTTPKISLTSVVADASSKPVSVFPGMQPSNGSATPWKKPLTADTTPASSRPSSAIGSKPPPPVAAKPKPPVIPVKPSVSAKGPAKPPIPTAPRPPAASTSRSSKPATAVGQVDLAAALAKRAQRIADSQ